MIRERLLPVSDSSSEAANILEKNTSFRWRVAPFTWADLDDNDLRNLIRKAGGLIGFTPEQASCVDIDFCDCEPITYWHEGRQHSHLAVASCLLSQDAEGNIIGCLIRFNRDTNRIRKQLAQVARHSCYQETFGLVCVLESPLEYIVWILGEELKHAQVGLKAANEKTKKHWQERYEATIKRKQRTFSHNRSCNLQEITATRTVLRILARLFPQRAAYFKELYKESLRTGEAVFPDLSRIKYAIFIRDNATL